MKEWILNDEQQSSKLTKQRNNKTAKLQNSEEQNSDHNKTANVTKERTFVKNGELTIQNMDNFLLRSIRCFSRSKNVNSPFCNYAVLLLNFAS